MAMTTCERQRTALTERILAIISGKGMSQTVTAQLAGMRPQLFYDRVKFGNWRDHELHDVATALNMRIGELLDD